VRYAVVLSRSAMRALQQELPESVSAAVIEFLQDPLAENPRQVGKALQRELTGMWGARRGQYRIIYTIDDDRILVTVIKLSHRRDAYRGRR